MDFREQKEYILFTTVAFITGAVLFSLLPYLLNTISSDSYFIDTWSSAAFRFFGGGYLVMTIISAILLGKLFLSKAPTIIKVLAIVFFFFIYFMIMMKAVIVTLPYYLYTLYKVRTREATQKSITT